MKQKCISMLILLFVFFIISSFVLGASVNAEKITWMKLESDNFIVFYPEGYKYQAKESIYFLEKNISSISHLTANKNIKKIPIVIEDLGQTANGFTDPINYKIGIYTYPPGSYTGLSGYENWYRLVNIHEATHMAHMTNNNDTSNITSKIFGNLFSPNLHSPLWLIEGIAVYSESQLSPFSGRLNGGYYNAIYRAKAAAQNLPSLSEITYNHNHFPADLQYLYGAKFIQYLNKEYGEKKLTKFFNQYASYFWAPGIGDLLPAVGLDRAAKEIYKKSFSTLYNEWRNYSYNKFANYNIGGKEILSTENGYITNLTPGDYANLYYFRTEILQNSAYNYRAINQLIEYNTKTGEEKVLVKTLASNYGTIEKKENKIYYLLADYERGFTNINNSSFGTISRLYEYNLNTGEKNIIFKGEIRDFTVFDNGEIICALSNKDQFGSKLISLKGQKQNVMGEVPEIISEMKNYNNKLVVVSKKQLSTWDVNYIDIKDLSLEPIINIKNAERMINIINDKLIFTANYDSREAIYFLDLKTNKVKEMTKKGYTVNGVLMDGELYFLSYTDKGMSIFKTNARGTTFSKFLKNNDNYSDKIDLKEMDLKIKEEKVTNENLKYLLKPGIRFFPYLLQGSDPLGYNFYQLSYSIHGGFDFKYRTKYFNPCTITINSILKEKKRKNELKIGYPIYKSQKNGLKEVKTNFYTDFEQYLLGGNINYSFPLQSINFSLKINPHNTNYSSILKYNYYLKEGEISLKGEKYSGINDKEDIREFQPEVEVNNLNKYSLDYTRKLFEIRKGLWNPNIFIGDMYFDLFLDYSISSTNDYEKLSGGTELSLETGMANWLQFTPKWGFAVSQEGENKFFIGFDFSF